MPVLTVYGIPTKERSSLQINVYLRPGLKEAVAGIQELGLSKKEVSVFFHYEDTDGGFIESQRDVVVFVDGLFEKPERTDEVLNRLARIVVEKVQEFQPLRVRDSKRKVECFVRPFNPARGFYSS